MRLSEEDFCKLLRNSMVRSSLQKAGVAPVPASGRGKPPKYRNVKVYCYEDGFVSYEQRATGHGSLEAVFDSIKEYDRFNTLKLQKRAGLISDLERQVPLIIQKEVKRGNEVIKPIVYRADFAYHRDGTYVVEDVKPFDKRAHRYRTTKDFALKWKLLKAKYPSYAFELF